MMSKNLLTATLLPVLMLVAIRVEPCLGGPEMNPLIAPTATEWQHFNKMTDPQLEKLWTFEWQRGHRNLGDWSWQWRMGWLQRCEVNVLPDLCPKILSAGLKDDAMVVRAEAATRIGKRYAGKPSKKLLYELSNAYRNNRNSRHGNPLFVCERILEAMQNIGGEKFHDIAEKLASKHQATQSYWAKIKGRQKN